MFIDSDDERMARVYGTAARIANPDKRLTNGHGDGWELLETTYTLWGEPRRAGPSEGGTEYEIVENLFGTVRAPSLDGPSGRWDDAIDAVGADLGIDSEDSVEKARETIDGLPQTLDAVAVVEFADSMTTERLVAFNRRHKICGGAGVSYIYSPSYYDDSSTPPSMNAVVWNRDMTKKDIWADLTYHPMEGAGPAPRRRTLRWDFRAPRRARLHCAAADQRRLPTGLRVGDHAAFDDSDAHPHARSTVTCRPAGVRA
ncbi:hypothetical protein [Nonomuraea sp. B19D2]|uniref:hypothetical protein n=1 Tax=Nonomuraea sp. B19D2 TaxID=3159561 RepID=UPI0032DA9DF6